MRKYREYYTFDPHQKLSDFTRTGKYNNSNSRIWKSIINFKTFKINLF